MSCFYTFIFLLIGFQIFLTAAGTNYPFAPVSAASVQQVDINYKDGTLNCLSQLIKTELARVSLKRFSLLNQQPLGSPSNSAPLMSNSESSSKSKNYFTREQFQQISEKLDEMVREKCAGSNSTIIESQLDMIGYLVNKIKRVHSKFRLFPKKKTNKFSNFSFFYNYLKRYPYIDEHLLVGDFPRPLLESFNSNSFPIGCKYILFERLVFKDALHHFHSIIFNDDSNNEVKYWKEFDHHINSVDVSKYCIGKGGRTEFVDVYNEISKYFPKRNVIGQLMILNRDNSIDFRNEISSLADYWFGIVNNQQRQLPNNTLPSAIQKPLFTNESSRTNTVDSTITDSSWLFSFGTMDETIPTNNRVTIVGSSFPEQQHSSEKIETSRSGTAADEKSIPLLKTDGNSVSKTLNELKEWFLGISIVRHGGILMNFLYRDVYLTAVAKTQDVVIWLVNIVDFSQTQLEEANPYMLDNPYVSFISHSIVSVSLTMLIMAILPYLNSVSFGIFLMSALSMESLTLWYMFLDNTDRIQAEKSHIVSGEKLWVFYQLLNVVYIPMISVVLFCKNRNAAAFIPAFSCYLLSQLYIGNSVAMFEFFSQIAVVLFTVAILRWFNFGEFIVRDVLVETVKQDLEIDKLSILGVNNKQAYEIIKQYNESRQVPPTTIFIDERPSDPEKRKPATAYDMFVHEFSHIPIEPALHTMVDALLGPVDELDVSEFSKEMPSSPCPTYTEDIRE